MHAHLFIPAVGLLLLFSGCKRAQEHHPFKGGESFTYLHSGGLQRTYTISKRDEYFVLTETIKGSHGTPSKDSYRFDAAGMIPAGQFTKGSLKQLSYDDRRMKLWIPRSQRKVGARVPLAGVAGASKVASHEPCGERRCVIVKHSLAGSGTTFKYDITTGFLVEQLEIGPLQHSNVQF